jgi:hypothetical protein
LLVYLYPYSLNAAIVKMFPTGKFLRLINLKNSEKLLTRGVNFAIVNGTGSSEEFVSFLTKAESQVPLRSRAIEKLIAETQK